MTGDPEPEPRVQKLIRRLRSPDFVVRLHAGTVLGGTSQFGGIGTIAGTVIGMFIPVVLQNGFIITGVKPFWQEVAVGAVLILAVYLDQLRRRTQYRT